MPRLLIPNGPMQTTASFATVTTGTSLKTMLQVKPSATANAKIVEWGISFDGSAAATPLKVELIETGTVFATVTASAQADITILDGGEAAQNLNVTTNLIQVGTTATGYTSTGEGSITAVRNFDLQLLPPTQPYVKQFPLGREPMIVAGSAMRIRVLAGTAVNAYCYVVLDI